MRAETSAGESTAACLHTGNTRDGQRAKNHGWKRKGCAPRAHPWRAFPGERRREHGTRGDGWPEPAASTQPRLGVWGDTPCEGDPSTAGTDSSSPPPFLGCTSSHPKTH